MGGSGLRAALAAGRLAGCVAVVAWGGSGAQAAIIGTCTINVLSTGEMTASPAIDRLGSKEAGGQAARVSITANSLVCVVLGLIDCYSISAPAPAAFLSYPPDGDAGVSFSSSYRIGGGPDLPGSQVTKVVNGTYMISIDLAAERASGVFPSGAYQAQVTVRCE